MSETIAATNSAKIKPKQAKTYYTPGKAAAQLLGWTGPRCGRDLLRLVLAKERKEGREIAVRVPSANGATKGTRYQLTETALMLHFPELFQGKLGELEVAARAKMESVESKVGALIDERLAADVGSLRSEITRIDAELRIATRADNEWSRRIERRLSSLERAMENITAQLAARK